MRKLAVLTNYLEIAWNKEDVRLDFLSVQHNQIGQHPPQQLQGHLITMAEKIETFDIQMRTQKYTKIQSEKYCTILEI